MLKTLLSVTLFGLLFNYSTAQADIVETRVQYGAQIACSKGFVDPMLLFRLDPKLTIERGEKTSLLRVTGTLSVCTPANEEWEASNVKTHTGALLGVKNEIAGKTLRYSFHRLNLVVSNSPEATGFKKTFTVKEDGSFETQVELLNEDLAVPLIISLLSERRIYQGGDLVSEARDLRRRFISHISYTIDAN